MSQRQVVRPADDDADVAWLRRWAADPLDIGVSIIPAAGRPQTAADQVTRLLAARILDRADEEGSMLPSEVELRQEFGISHRTAAEVLANLARVRLVDVKPGGPTRARPRDEWDYLDPLLFELDDTEGTHRLISELTHVRLVLEPEVAAWAATSADAELLDRMAATVAGMRRNSGNQERCLGYDFAFHALLVEATGNRVLGRIMESIRALLYTSRQVLGLLPESIIRAIEYHETIRLAVAAGDADGARNAMREHLMWVMRSYGIEELTGAGSDGDRGDRI